METKKPSFRPFEAIFGKKEERPEVSVRTRTLNDANKIINGERQGAYGDPENNFKVIADLWSIYLDKKITPDMVAVMMVLMKAARCKSGVYKEDNWVDMCGYAALGNELQSNK